MKVLAVGGVTTDTIAVIASERMTMRNAGTSFLSMEEGKKIEAQVSSPLGGRASQIHSTEG
jgi:hypothetical protein